MYRDDYRDRRDDLSRDIESSRYLPPPRDLYYEDRVRERSYADFDDLDRKRYGHHSLDEPYYRHPLDDLEPRRSRPDPLPPLPHSSLGPDDSTPDPNSGVVICGSVIVIPPSPFEKRPTVRIKIGVCKTVFVGSLPDNISNKNLHDLFGRCGKVLDIRVSKGRNFGHVQFELEEDVERALLLSGCRIRIGPSNSLGDMSKIHVDYAQPRSDSEIQKRVESSEPLVYSATNAGLITAELHGEDTFWTAARNIKTWLEKGSCNSGTGNTFFGLISSCNTHSRKVAKKLKDYEQEDKEWSTSRNRKYERLLKECKAAEDVLMTACTQKSAWDSFTKPQRKSINLWKESAGSLSKDLNAALGDDKDGQSEEPATKKVKVESSEPKQDHEAAMEELKTEHAAALRKKETQIMQLNTLISQFKKQFPNEWEKVIGGKGGESTKKDEETMKEEDTNSTEDPLAANAAAYAKMRSVLGSTDDSKSPNEFSEAEVAIITVLSTFLTVNPLGATVDEIVAYFNKYNPTVSGVYLESLLCRLPQVFQLSQQSSEVEKKWWFLGFQTCCSQGQYAMQDTSENNGNNSNGGTSSAPTAES